MNGPLQSTVRVWDLPVRVFHWSFAVAFAGAYLLGESERWRDVHVALGYAAAALVGFRLVWGFVGTHHARFASFRYTPVQAWQYLSKLSRGQAAHHTGHNPAGSWAIYALLALGLATAVSGWLRYEDVGGEAVEAAHELLANAWLGLVILHVAAVLTSSVLHRENLPRAMLSGYKQAAAGEPDVAPRTAVGVGLLLATVALVAGLIVRGAGSVESPPGAKHPARSEIAGHARPDDD